MTVKIQFSPEVEAKLRQRAQATGTDVEHVVREAVEEKFGGGEHVAVSAPPQERAKRWHAWVEGMTHLATKNLPPGHFVDDSRESIYAGRGE
jgi:hypothetical protein